MTEPAHGLQGWTPTAVEWAGARPAIRWCFTEGVEFTDPFFEQTIDRCLRDPFRLLFWRETGLESLAEFASASPGLPPVGFILHMSRCGSTLLAQMFARLPGVLVMSEPPSIDALLRSRSPRPETGDRDLVDWLRWMMSALGQPRQAGQRAFVVKLDAWAIFDLPLIRMAFPDAAYVFVYRDPVEVLVSQLDRRGYHMIPGALPPDWFGFSADEVHAVSPEQYCAAVLAALCENALRAARAGELTLIEYRTLPAAVPDIVAPVFGIDIGSAERALLAGVAESNAKNPLIPFVADGVEKRRRASPAVRAAVDVRLGAVYESLETLRRVDRDRP
ncbi:MAG: sulfotransferase [Actinomycetota bacterium]|nr:sulfotransferase [Actinomycetota bacterium]